MFSATEPVDFSELTANVFSGYEFNRIHQLLFAVELLVQVTKLRKKPLRRLRRRPQRKQVRRLVRKLKEVQEVHNLAK